MINGQKGDVAEYKLVADEFLKRLDRVQLQGIVFHQGLANNEVELFLESVSRIKPQMIEKNYWRRFSDEHQLVHLDLKQVQYTVMIERDKKLELEMTPRKKRRPCPEKSFPSHHRGAEAGPRGLGSDSGDYAGSAERHHKHQNLPLHSKTVTRSIQQLQEALQSILTKWHVLTLAQVSKSLVVNRVKIDPTGIEWLVEGIRKFFDSIKLTSLTFLEGLSTQELKSFLGALSQLPPSGINRSSGLVFPGNKASPAFFLTRFFTRPGWV